MGSFVRSLVKDLSSSKGILVPHLDNWFARGKFPDTLKFEINPNKEKDDAFHPSSALKCHRVIYASKRKELAPEKFDATSHKTFMFGHYCHALIQHILVEELGFAKEEDIEREFFFSDTHPKATAPGFKTPSGLSYEIRGFLDVAHCEIPNHGDYLVDVKTMASRLFAMSEMPWATLEKYEAQVKLYMEFADQEECIILCAEKDNPHRFKEVLVKRDPDFVDKVLEGWEHVVECLANEVVPDCTCDRPDFCPAKAIYEGSGA